MSKIKVLLCFLIFFININTQAQQYNFLNQRTSERIIRPAVPMMTLAPDARAAGMGDVGVATKPDVNSAYWNVGKLSLIDHKTLIGFSYTPWKTDNFENINIYNATGSYKIKQKHVVGLSTTIYKWQYDNFMNFVSNIKPTEFYISGSYSLRLLDNMGVGISLKFINTNLPQNVLLTTADIFPSRTIAMDLGWYWDKEIGKNSNLGLGAAINNIGGKIAYSSDDRKKPIPTNIRLGSSYKYTFNNVHSLSIAIDLSKLMVPSPPEYAIDSNGNTIRDENGEPVINRGKNPDRPLFSSMFGSFSDAPGGINEELQEIQLGGGLEYWYKNFVAIRGGYSWEHFEKGDRKYFTTGLGLQYDIVGIDLSYLIPHEGSHTLKETLRFSVYLQLGKAENDKKSN